MDSLIPRPRFVEAVERGLLAAPVVALLGARQCGKTTLARGIVSSRDPATVTFFDLDDLRLDKLTVVYPGEEDYVLDEGIEVRGLRNVGVK